MESNKILAIFTDTVTEDEIEIITSKHKDLVHDFSNEAEFKAARKVKTEMNKLLKEVDTVGIAAAKQVTSLRNELKDKIEGAYSGTVTPFYIEDQKRKNEAQRLKDEKEARLKEQSDKLAMIKGASARAMHLPIDDIEDILQEVMSIDLAFFDEDMQQEAKSSKEISLAQLQDAFKFAGQKEEMRKAEELQKAELADKEDEIESLKKQLAAMQPEQAKEKTFLSTSEKTSLIHHDAHMLIDLFGEEQARGLFEDSSGGRYEVEVTATRKELLN